MANTLNTAERQILRTAFEAYKSQMAPLNAFTVDADAGTPGQPVGGSVIVKLATARTASIFAGDYRVSNGTTFTDKTVTLAHHAYTTFQFTDIERGQHAFNVMEAAAVEAASATARNVFDYVTGIITDTSYGSTAGQDHLASVAVGSFDADDVVDLGKLMDIDNVPQMNRSLLVIPAAHANLKKDNALQSADASGSTGTLREGVTGRVDRFDVYMTSAMNTSATETNLGVYAFACHPTAMAVAIRTVPPGNESGGIVRYGEMVDPVSGIRLGMRRWYDPNAGRDLGTFESYVGRAAVQADGIARCKAFA